MHTYLLLYNEEGSSRASVLAFPSDYLKWEQMWTPSGDILDLRVGLDGKTTAHAQINSSLSCYIHLELI